jgi:organic radical activating enzyme
VTITGGEPLQQMQSVITLLRGVKDIGNIGTIVLTGFSKEQCFELSEFNIFKKFADVLIAGKYKQDLKLQEGIRGSKNKHLILFTNLYSQEEFNQIPPVEVFVDHDGSVSITGIKPEILNTISK